MAHENAWGLGRRSRIWGLTVSQLFRSPDMTGRVRTQIAKTTTAWRRSAASQFQLFQKREQWPVAV